jgi:nicotinamidase-related amidase
MDLQRQSLTLGSRPALVVVDMINGFTHIESPLGSEADDVVEANATLIRAFHARQLPVVFTTVVYHHDAQASVFRARLPALNILTPDSNWVQVDPRLPKADTDLLIEKTHASAFHDTNLQTQLQALGVDSLVVTGLTTSGCVRATAVDGLQYNYPVVVPREAVGDRNAAAHTANLHDLHAKYVDVLSLSETLTLLQ